MSLDRLLKEAIKTKSLLRTGEGGGGCINQGEAYSTDEGKVFVKRNGQAEARRMFDGEFQSLVAIKSTNTVDVPNPIAVVDNPSGGAVLVMDFVDMRSLNRHSARLGEELAKMHLHNETLLNANDSGGSVHRKSESDGPVDKFGFHVTTCCGYLPQDNSWCADWPTFYFRQKLRPQVELVQESYGDRQVGELLGRIERKIPQMFAGLEIKPALLHGDLWSGNVAETASGPVVFDPASFYGHSEYEFSISLMFGGFSKDLFKAYDKIKPKDPGYNDRIPLYKLFHNLNHWNHFGGGYKESSLAIMKQLAGK